MNNTEVLVQNDLNIMVNNTANKKIEYIRCEITELEQEERVCRAQNDYIHDIELKMQIDRKWEQIEQIEGWRRIGLVTP